MNAQDMRYPKAYKEWIEMYSDNNLSEVWHQEAKELRKIAMLMYALRKEMENVQTNVEVDLMNIRQHLKYKEDVLKTGKTSKAGASTRGRERISKIKRTVKKCEKITVESKTGVVRMADAKVQTENKVQTDDGTRSSKRDLINNVDVGERAPSQATLNNCNDDWLADPNSANTSKRYGPSSKDEAPSSTLDNVNFETPEPVNDHGNIKEDANGGEENAEGSLDSNPTGETFGGIEMMTREVDDSKGKVRAKKKCDRSTRDGVSIEIYTIIEEQEEEEVLWQNSASDFQDSNNNNLDDHRGQDDSEILEISESSISSPDDEDDYPPDVQENLKSSFVKPSARSSEEEAAATSIVPRIACTRLTKDQASAIFELVDKGLATYNSKVDSSVTHMIVAVTEDDCIREYTMKFLSAVAAGIWVLNSGWIEECLRENRIVPEGPYEALDIWGSPGPSTSRLTRDKFPLLEGYKFYCAGPFIYTTREQVEELLRQLKGRVVRGIEDLLEDDGNIGLIIGQGQATQDFEQYQRWAEQYKTATVSIGWLSRCVGQYKVTSIRPYLWCSEDNLDDFGYPRNLTETDETSL